jgi:ubiquitin-protein ligase
MVTRTTLLSLLSVLHNPIIDGFTSNETIAENYERDYNDYHETVRLYTEEYATPKRPDLAAL